MERRNWMGRECTQRTVEISLWVLAGSTPLSTDLSWLTFGQRLASPGSPSLLLPVPLPLSLQTGFLEPLWSTDISFYSEILYYVFPINENIVPHSHHKSIKFRKFAWIQDYHFIHRHHSCVCAQSLQSCSTLCNPMDHSPPDSSVHGILRARRVEWAAMPSSRGSS